MHQMSYQEYEARERSNSIEDQDGREIEKKGEEKAIECSAYLDVSDQIVP